MRQNKLEKKLNLLKAMCLALLVQPWVGFKGSRVDASQYTRRLHFVLVFLSTIASSGTFNLFRQICLIDKKFISELLCSSILWFKLTIKIHE